jgi:hypothetical protein
MKMSEAMIGYKGLAVGLLALVVGASMVPAESLHFDRLRIKKPRITTPTTEPVPTPVPTPTTTNALYTEATMIPTNFDITPELGTVPVAQSAAPDNVGAFRFICTAGQIRADDPIVYPNQPGRSHLHQFFGNTEANASSTYDSLRKTGQSTCMSPVNRSAYWMPAMLNGRGMVIRPDHVTIYYKRRPASSPACQQMGKACIPLPNGLRYVFGFNMQNPASAPTGAFHFRCAGAGALDTSHFKDIVSAAVVCPPGARLGAVVDSPSCWDGTNLDSPDHRSHLAYPSYGWWGYLKCPTTHQFIIPRFTMGAWYGTDDTLDRSGTWEPGKTVTWHLSSDVVPGSLPSRPGSTFHADWFGAWDPTVQATWTENCIDKMLNCSAGDLGNGQRIRQTWPFSWTANPRLVPIPS